MGTVTTTYYAESLDEVADHFVEKATEMRHRAASYEKLKKPKYLVKEARVEAAVWDTAARIIRNTVIGVEPKPFSQAMCKHEGYTTHGSQNYPYNVDRGPYCPTCDEVVEL